jgi:hypothetical protein
VVFAVLEGALFSTVAATAVVVTAGAGAAVLAAVVMCEILFKRFI